MLRRFIHGENGKVLGTVVAIKTEDNEFGVGWSISKSTAKVHDVPVKDIGLKIAQGRAMSDRRTVSEEVARIPNTPFGDFVAQVYVEMYERASRYYKNCSPLQVNDVVYDECDVPYDFSPHAFITDWK